MICKNCNKEIENTFSVCPFCGEKCTDDNIFHEMLNHVMEDNTQSSQEIAKLKEQMKKRKKNRRRNRIIAALSAATAVLVAIGGFFIISEYKERTTDHGSFTYRGGFDGTVFSVYDEEGREIRTISGGIYTENTYGTGEQRTLSTTYNGYVSFEKAEFKNNIPVTVYNFDGTSGYTYKDFTYETDNNGLIARAEYSSKTGENTGVYEYSYDENGNKTAQYQYEFESTKSYNYDYDSVGRMTGEQEYSIKGHLIFDKQYSYKSDGSLYLSSINEIYKTDASGNAESYKLTNFTENGKALGSTINAPDGTLLGTIEYSYNDKGRLAAAKYYNTASVQTGWELYDYYENGDLKKYAKKDNGIESAQWYTYSYHDNGTKAVTAISASEGSTDYISYTTYDVSGREIKNTTSTSNTEKEYGNNGLISKLSTYSAQGELIKQTSYTYNADGNCTEQIDYAADGSVIEKRTYAYDGMGNVINQAGGNADHLYINEYNDYGDLTAVTTYRLVSSEILEYDENGYITKQTVNNITYGFERLADGRIDTKYTYNPDGSVLSHVKYKYNKTGDQTGLVSYNPDGTTSGHTEINYDDRLKIITLTSYDNNDEVYYELMYNYSIDKPEIRIMGKNRFENKTTEYEYQYSFDENGQLSEVVYTKNGEKTTEYSYAYDEAGDVISGLVKQIASKETETRYDYTYSGGFLSSSAVTSPDGKTTKTEYAVDENKRPYIKVGG